MGWSNIGRQIKALRTAQSMTQEALAYRLNVSKATVSAYENGSRLPSYDVLVKIASLFHVSTDNLLGRSDTYSLDATGLTFKQKNIIQDIISTYQDYNRNHKVETDT